MSDLGWAITAYGFSVVVAFVWFIAGVLEARDRGDRPEARRRARLAFAAPGWPLFLVIVAARGLVWLVRLATEADVEEGQ